MVAPNTTPLQPAPRKLLLVDDHPITRQGLKSILASQPQLTVAAEADTVAAALELARIHRVHLVVLDVSLRAGNGLELLRQLKAINPEIKVLVMSMHEESLFAERAIGEGASGYLMKAEASEKLIIAINKVLRGDLFLSNSMTVKLAPNARRSVVPPSGMSSLSVREKEVFCMLGNGHSTKAIADSLGLSVKTIDTYREHLKTKLDIANGTELVAFAIKWCNAEALAPSSLGRWDPLSTAR